MNERIEDQVLDPSYRRPLKKENTSVVDVMSYLQRTSVMEERAKEEYSKDLFTIRHSFDFIYAGIKLSLIEVLFVGIYLIFYFISNIMYFNGNPMQPTNLLLVSYLPIIPILIVTFLLLYLTKYSKGPITARGLKNLFVGRTMSLFTMGGGLVFIAYVISYNMQNYVLTKGSFVSKFVKIGDVRGSEIIQNTATSFYSGGWKFIVYTLCFAIITPYIFKFIKRPKKKQNKHEL